MAFPFEIDEGSDVPLWVQLRKRLVYLINTGHYRTGDQLPTVRGLASELSINYNTVNKAYLSMVNDGYITSTRGRGVFVRDFESSAEEETALDAVGLIDDCVRACRDLGLTTEEIRMLLLRRSRMLDDDGAPGDGAPSDGRAPDSGRTSDDNRKGEGT
jgi:GntR family transcriptional regulator